jgi:hypothetical protein
MYQSTFGSLLLLVGRPREFVSAKVSAERLDPIGRCASLEG